MMYAIRLKKIISILVPTVILLASAACNKQILVENLSVPVDNFSVSVDPTQPGMHIPSNFTGLSFETSLLPQGLITSDNTELTQLIASLGAKGVIRVGGRTTDDIFWADTARNGSTDIDSLFTDDIIDAFNLSRATGWPVIFGLNLPQSTSLVAASEADYIVKEGGTSLSALEIGNSPDLYTSDKLKPLSYTYADFQGEWLDFYSKIHAASPDAVFAGPSTAFLMSWLLPFIAGENSRVKEASQHYFSLGPPSGSGVTVSNLLLPNPALTGNLITAMAACRSAGIPLRLDECNSVSGGGKKGVSNTFASALWGLDFMFTAASLGVSGVNFQDSASAAYNPIQVTAGHATAAPLYYGLLCFQLASQGRLIPVSFNNPSGLNMTAYGVLTDEGVLLLTFINKDSQTSADITIHTGMTLKSSGYVELTAAALTSTSGVTLGGRSVASDGTFTMPSFTGIPYSADSTRITVPAYTATVVSLH